MLSQLRDASSEESPTARGAVLADSRLSGGKRTRLGHAEEDSDGAIT